MKEIEQKLSGKIDRLTNKTFKFDERVGEGWFSAVYFLKTREIVERKIPNNTVTMQFFQRKDSVLCGTDEVIALIQTFATNPEELEVYSLKDGDKIEPYETVLTIKGPYQHFGFLEGIIDGIFARRTSVATNVYIVAKALRESGFKKLVILMMGFLVEELPLRRMYIMLQKQLAYLVFKIQSFLWETVMITLHSKLVMVMQHLLVDQQHKLLMR